MIVQGKFREFKLDFDMNRLYSLCPETEETLKVIESLSVIDYKLTGEHRTVIRKYLKSSRLATDEEINNVTNAVLRVIKGTSKRVIIYMDFDADKPNTGFCVFSFELLDGELVVHLLDTKHNSTDYFTIDFSTPEYICFISQKGYVSDTFLRKVFYELINVEKLLKGYRRVKEQGAEPDPTVALYIQDFQRQTGTLIRFGMVLSKERKLAILEKFYTAYNTIDTLLTLSNHKPLGEIVIMPKSQKRYGAFRDKRLIEITIETAERHIIAFTSTLLHEYMHYMQYDLLSKDNPHHQWNTYLYMEYMLPTLRQFGKQGMCESVYNLYMRKGLTYTQKHFKYLMDREELVCRGMETYFLTQYLNPLESLPNVPAYKKERLLTDRELSVVMDVLARAKFSFE